MDYIVLQTDSDYLILLANGHGLGSYIFVDLKTEQEYIFTGFPYILKKYNMIISFDCNFMEGYTENNIRIYDYKDRNFKEIKKIELGGDFGCSEACLTSQNQLKFKIIPNPNSKKKLKEKEIYFDLP